MKINQLATIMRYSPLVHMGYIFRTTKPGLGLVEEMKKIAANIWNQKFVYINMTACDMYDVYLMKVQYRNEPVTYFFDNMEQITDTMRNDIMIQFSINRTDNIHNESHVIYNSNEYENSEYYKVDDWNEYVTLHGMCLKIEP